MIRSVLDQSCYQKSEHRVNIHCTQESFPTKLFTIIISCIGFPGKDFFFKGIKGYMDMQLLGGFLTSKVLTDFC